MGLFGFGKKQEKDPVCGMTVDPKTAAGSAEHADKTYYFCSANCRQRFVAKPSQYAS